MTNEGAWRCTTRFENAHRTALREVLYRHHPWFGRQICVHGAVDKGGFVVFRCTLEESQVDRWLEVPAWMFDRTACPNPGLLAAQPYVSVEALAALSALLDLALKDQTPSAVLLSGASRGLSRSESGRDCQSALEWDPLSASKRDPFDRRVLLVALASSELVGVAETARARVV